MSGEGAKTNTARRVVDLIAAAAEDIAKIEFSKNGRVKGSSEYSYIPIGQILGAVRAAHAKHGIVVLFSRPEYDADMCEKRYSETRKTQWGGETRWQVANGHIRITILGAGCGDALETDIGFEVQDNSDKLTNKIYTNAERSLYRTLYAIDEGDASDPEAINVAVEDVVRPPAKADPFFSKPPAASPARKPGPRIIDTDIGPVEDGEAVTDRPIGTMRASLRRWYAAGGLAREAIRPFVKDHGSDFEAWTDEEVREAYKTAAMRGRGLRWRSSRMLARSPSRQATRSGPWSSRGASTPRRRRSPSSRRTAARRSAWLSLRASRSTTDTDSPAAQRPRA